MAVAVTQIDAQNVGLRLLGQTNVNVLTLNLATGKVESPYLLQPIKDDLQVFAGRLFQTVPVSARAAGALGLLSRLCAISPADSSVVTTTAVVSSGIATLNASIRASPGTIILTMPFAMTGGIMPTGGSSSSPGPGPGTDGNVIEADVFDVDTLDVVRIGLDGTAERADCGDPSSMPAIGVVQEILSPGRALIRVAGVIDGFPLLEAGRIHFVGQAGTITPFPPAIAGNMVQAIGFAISSTTLAVAPSTAITMR